MSMNRRTSFLFCRSGEIEKQFQNMHDFIDLTKKSYLYAFKSERLKRQPSKINRFFLMEDEHIYNINNHASNMKTPFGMKGIEKSNEIELEEEDGGVPYEENGE